MSDISVRSPCDVTIIGGMSSVSAELAYLFRHALLRSGAYELQLPSERARLHGLVVRVGLELWGGSDESLAPYAAELAGHAALASEDAEVAKVEARLLKIGGTAAQRRGNSYDALSLLSRLADCEAADPASRNMGRLGAATAADLLGRPAEALHRLEQVLADPTSGPADLVSALTRAVDVYSATGDRAAAASAAEEARRKAQLTADPRLSAMAQTALARVHEQAGHMDEARAALHTALDLTEHLPPDHSRARALFSLGSLFQQLNQPDNAEREFRSVFELAEALGNLTGMASSRAALAMCARLKGSLAMAERELLASKRTFQDVGHVANHANLCNVLGNLYLDQGRLTEAVSNFDEGISVCREHGQFSQLGLYEGNRALALHKLGRNDEAISAMEAAVLTARATGSASAETTNLANLVSLYENVRRYDDAEKLAAEALPRCRATGNRRFEVQCLMTLSGIFADSGRLGRALATQDQADRAIEAGADHFSVIALAAVQIQLGIHLGEFDRAASILERVEALELPAVITAAELMPLRLSLRVANGGSAATAQADLTELKAYVSKRELEINASVVSSVGRCEALARELEMAAQEGRGALVFRGYRVAELSPLLRLALVDRMRELQPAAYAALVADPALHSAMLAGTEGLATPDWRDATPV